MKKYIISIGILLGMFAVPVALVDNTSAAVNVFEETCKKGSTGAICQDTESGKETVSNIIDLLFYLIGIIAVVVIIVGGVKFVTADGDASKVKSGRDTIMYAVVGLVVAIMAYAIVAFVVNRLG